MAAQRSLKRSLYFNFLAAALLPIAIVSLLVLSILTNQTLQNVTVKNMLLARAMSGKVEIFLREPRAVLQGMGRLVKSGDGLDSPTVRRMLDAYVQTSQIFDSIYILGPGGKVENVGLRAEKKRLREDFLGIDLSHLGFFERARRTGQVTWSDTFPSLISGKVSLALAVPVDQRILVGNINLDILYDFVYRLHAGDQVFVTIVDRSGSIIVHPDPTVTGRQVNIGHLPLIREGLAGREETEVYTLDEEKYLGSVSRIAGTGWLTVASQTTSDAYRHVRIAGTVFLAGAVGAVLLAMLLAFLRATKLSRPLAEFTQRATAVAGGNYEVSFSGSSFLELENIAGSFLRMVDAIRRREKQLVESRERYRDLVEKINDGMGVIDSRGRFTYVNPRLAEMLGFSAADLLSRPVEDFLAPGNRELFRRYCIRREAPARDVLELEWVRQDQSSLYTIFSSQSISRETAEGGCVAMVTDITPLKRAQLMQLEAREQAEAAREQLDAVLSSVADGLVVTDLESRTILMNRAAGNLLRVSPETLSHRPLREALAEDALCDLVEAVMEKQTPVPAIDLEFKAASPEEETRTVQVRNSLAFNREGRTFGIILLLRDVTRERQVDRMKDEFISTVAHEFRTPLTSIQGFSQVLLTEEELSDADKKEFLTYIHERSITLAGIVANLLDIARIREGRPLAVDRREWSVEDLLRQVEPFLKTQAARHRFEVDISGKENQLWVDREKVGQVLENLLSNAVKYSPQGSLITLRGEVVPEGYLVSVRDRGIGMGPEEVEHVFDKFYRVDATDTAVQGVGLGMSIVKMIIEQHGGWITVDSARGEGTTVSFLLPARNIHEEGADFPSGHSIL